MSETGSFLPTNLVNGTKTESRNEDEERDDAGHDPQFEPIISLPEVSLPTLEEDEVELIKLRAKLFRYDSRETPPEWKERGTGDVKLLRHPTKNTVRVLMRRDRTLRICANHFVTPLMELKPNCGSDRAWVWSVLADFADETVKTELLAIRFANADNAKKWKETFEEAKHIVATQCKLFTESEGDDEEDDDSPDSGNEEASGAEEEEEGIKKGSEEVTTGANEAVEALEKLDLNKSSAEVGEKTCESGGKSS